MAGVIVGLLVAALLIYRFGFSPEARERQRLDAERQSRIVCPHCHTAGSVTRSLTTRKQGISGGKATGAIFTGGLSLFATGLSRKQDFTTLFCSNCGTTWDA